MKLSLLDSHFVPDQMAQLIIFPLKQQHFNAEFMPLLLKTSQTSKYCRHHLGMKYLFLIFTYCLNGAVMQMHRSPYYSDGMKRTSGGGEEVLVIPQGGIRSQLRQIHTSVAEKNK